MFILGRSASPQIFFALSPKRIAPKNRCTLKRAKRWLIFRLTQIHSSVDSITGLVGQCRGIPASGRRMGKPRSCVGRARPPCGKPEVAVPAMALLALGLCAAAGAADCPSACQCSPRANRPGLQVECKTQGLTAVPAALPRATAVLNMGQNKIGRLGAGTLRKIPNLRSLNLEHNRLRELHPDAFAGTAKLVTLNFYDNQLGELPAGVFRNLVSLRYLLIGKNQILSLQPDALRGLGNLTDLDMPLNNVSRLPALLFRHAPRLRVLDLAYNRVARASPLALRGLRRLELLNLGGNRLSAVPPGLFAGLRRLDMLVLDNNRLAGVGGEALRGLAVLTQLYLSNNRLRHVAPAAFRHTPRLTQLALSGNCLATLDAGALARLSGLQQVFLHDNPWRCDCSAKPLLGWLLNSRVRLFPNSSLVCAAPPGVRGRSLHALSPSALGCERNRSAPRTRLPARRG
ncbi:reticulon-4 receptor-like 2 [Lethenteron reissneri]|uniref:reticulon-4 receptor-like 2 n=1 Tax=Lethenteron reissneri TaxID=7753 RepID=UPI002AB65D07|nr:reticulon-4 receptor-like 2 [Lethenteron reissneri]